MRAARCCCCCCCCCCLSTARYCMILLLPSCAMHPAPHTHATRVAPVSPAQLLHALPHGAPQVHG
ncbi:MAG: hypothetical protein ACK4ZJ_18050 [Allorhizobium sp.]